MKTPFEILEISEEADDKEIKKAYLVAVKSFPPERFPLQFKKIRKAYEQIRTEKDRLRYALFDTSLPDTLEIVEMVLKGKKKQDGRVDEKEFQRLLSVAVGKSLKISHE